MTAAIYHTESQRVTATHNRRSGCCSVSRSCACCDEADPTWPAVSLELLRAVGPLGGRRTLAMTDFEDFYLQLLQMDPTLRRRWLLEQRPVELSRTHWWFALIDSDLLDVRREQEGRPRTCSRADAARTP